MPSASWNCTRHKHWTRQQSKKNRIRQYIKDLMQATNNRIDSDFQKFQFYYVIFHILQNNCKKPLVDTWDRHLPILKIAGKLFIAVICQNW